MNSILFKKFKESFLSVLPITAVIIALNFILPDRMPAEQFVSFLIGAALLIIGMALYSLGSDTALAPIGETIGNRVTGTKNVFTILLVGFIIGVIVTVAEPDLLVLGGQLGDIKWILITTISLGVGVFLMIALARIFKKVNLNIILAILYGLTFILAIFVDDKYIALSFDSGGVTTGPITVPFIMALGVGVAGVLGGKEQKDNAFGVVAICSGGPIFTVLLLCLIFRPEIATDVEHVVIDGFSSLPPFIGVNLLECAKEVAIAILPVSAFFLLFNFIFVRLPSQRLVRILVGLVYTYVGLTLFLTGVNVGFMSTGLSLGQRLASLGNNRILVFVAAAIGSLMVLAEPAVHVLAKQVENISDGALKSSVIIIILCVSMIVAVGLSMLRLVLNISIWYFIVPGYVIAITLSFIVPKVYSSIAFDSGGVASGPMATMFMLPLAIGAATVVGGEGSVLFNAYGLIAFIALVPIITIQTLGVYAKIKAGRKLVIPKALLELFEGDVIELDSRR